MSDMKRNDLADIEIMQLNEALRMAHIAAVENFRAFMKSEGHALDGLDDDAVWSLATQFTLAIAMYGINRPDALSMVVDMLRKTAND